MRGKLAPFWVHTALRPVVLGFRARGQLGEYMSSSRSGPVGPGLRTAQKHPELSCPRPETIILVGAFII